MTTHLALFLYSLAWAGLTILISLAVWQFTKHYYAREWLRFAPQKARDVVRQAQRNMSAVSARCRQLETENAELRGRIGGIQQLVAKMRYAELVERRGA